LGRVTAGRRANLDRSYIERILKQVRQGKLTTGGAVEKLAHCYDALGFAKVDVARELRTGVAEAVFCEGKTRDQVVAIACAIHKRSGRLLATRASRETYEAVKQAIPEAAYNEAARLIVVAGKKRAARGRRNRPGRVAVVSAGTSDIPVAEEAAATCEFMGNRVDRIYDVGVAGIHRLFGDLDRLRRAGVVVVAAGMEGALASVVSGLVSVPVVGVPTSVGYGASFKGLASLLGMLNSCAPGVTVVNIDNGFGAGVAASLIVRK
jgi:NCAIR mutase (PurE)-related protein